MEFQTYSTETEKLVQTFQQDLRKAISAVATLKLRTTQRDIQLNFFQGASDIATLLLINSSPASMDPPDPCNFLLLTARAHPSILEHVGLNEHSVCAFHKRLTEHPADAITAANIGDIDKSPFEAHQADLFRCLHAAYAQLWTTTLQQRQEKCTQAAMEKFLRSKTTAAATTAAHMEVDTEASADPKTLRKLITTEVSKATKPLKAQLDRLNQQTS